MIKDSIITYFWRPISSLFFEGFSQGFAATVHIDLLQGKDPHHTWESAFRALGEALRMAYGDNPWMIAAHNPFYADEKPAPIPVD